MFEIKTAYYLELLMPEAMKLLVSTKSKAFANNCSANVKLSKNKLHKIGQSVGFSGRLLGPLLKTVLPLIKNLLKPLTKSVLMPLGLTAAASAIDAAIHVWSWPNNINNF